MTIFVGSFQQADTLHRVLTILATTSIVITAVFILRMVGKVMYGVCKNPDHLKLHDATWDEKIAITTLVVCIAGLGLAPIWMSDMINYSVTPIVDHINAAATQLTSLTSFLIP